MQRNVEIAALQFREAFDRELRGMWGDLDEDALIRGAALMASAAADILK
jgi:hypothetical protein